MPAAPPPLPPDPPQPPLPYATPHAGGGLLPGRRGSSFHVGFALWSLALIAVWTLVLIFVVPRFAETFADFKMELPVTTRLLLLASTAARHGGFVVLLAIPIALGFAAGPLGPAGRHVLRLALTLLFALVLGATILGIFQPLMALMTAVGGPGGK